MRKTLAFIIFVFLGLGVTYWEGKVFLAEAESETRWIREEMWPGVYFNPIDLNLNEDQKVFIRNAGPDFTTRFGTDYLKEHVCDKETYSCTERRLALSNILINEGNLEQAKSFENLAAKYYVESEACPIMLETTLVRHIIKVGKNMSFDSAKRRAASALQQIKISGGIHSDLKTEACNSMIKDHPILFHNYVMIIAELMDHAGGSTAELSAYLRKVNKVNM